MTIRPGTYRRIVIIGAARSGTNILRDVLTALPGFGTWPCDEINYIWRHGNVTTATDEFSPELATPAVRSYIVNKFDEMAIKLQVPFLVEKTCANSLRVGFVERVIPDARYVFIVRDGRDVIASALKRWKARLDIPYLMRKARFVPPSDLLFYISRYAVNRLYRLGSHENRLAYWGPRFRGMREWLQHHSLPEVCAQQWVSSVVRAERDLSTIEPSRVMRLRYEDFVLDPDRFIHQIAQFVGANAVGAEVSEAVKSVRDQNIGKWRGELSSETIAQIMPIINQVQERYGYI